MTQRMPLPIDSVLGEIKDVLSRENTLVIQASPGSGKTTRVPPALLESIGRSSRVIVLEPRRLAAKLAANRVAFEMGEKIGQTVGYHIRFEKEFSADTKILFMTEGMLLRYMISDPELTGVGAVILDEFHERHLHTDVAIALVRRLQQTTRPDLRLVVMSATLDTKKLVETLAGPRLLDVQAPPHPLKVCHSAEATQSESVEMFSKRLFERVARGIQAADEVLAAKVTTPGDVLVFLPGAGEIQSCMDFLQRSDVGQGAAILALHGSLNATEQRRVLEPSSQRKIILATNIAESSLTIDGVNIVIDSGLAKVPSFSSWAGLPTLKLQRISQASCVQRSGRAARQGLGVAVRLYSEADFCSRSPHDQPEISRLDLTQTVLELSCIPVLNVDVGRVAGGADGSGAMSVVEFSASLNWVDRPDAVRFQSAVELLRFLGAIDDVGIVTGIGQEMARYPLHPRLARIVIEGSRRKLLPESCSFAAFMNEEAQGGRINGSSLQRSFDQIARIAGMTSAQLVSLPGSDSLVAAVTPLVLAGYADRVARFESDETWRLVDGRVVTIRNQKQQAPRWVCLVDAAASPSDPARIIARDWYPLAIDENHAMLAQVPGLWRQSPVTWWDSSGGGRVRSALRTSFGALVLREQNASVSADEAAPILRQELKRSWPAPFESDAELIQWHNRILVYSEAFKEAPVADLIGSDFEFLLDVLVDGHSSFAEVAQRSIGSCVEELIGYEVATKITAACPKSLTLPSKREAKIHYVPGQPPWVEGKIQEFFGWQRLPALAGGRLPLVVHLLAPNSRPVQVTADLEGFWSRHYPEIRRALARDYPRHFWPEDPLTAEPKVLVKQRYNIPGK